MIDRRSVTVFVAMCLFAVGSLGAAPCDRAAEYDRAVCLYHSGDLRSAAIRFEEIAERNAPTPETIRSLYFLARIRMKEGEWLEAHDLLVEIFDRSPVFYRAWSCDYLLGECRRALGRS